MYPPALMGIIPEQIIIVVALVHSGCTTADR
jgi:hypothetical protein